jgi:hypothetical protein
MLWLHLWQLLDFQWPLQRPAGHIQSQRNGKGMNFNSYFQYVLGSVDYFALLTQWQA